MATVYGGVGIAKQVKAAGRADIVIATRRFYAAMLSGRSQGDRDRARQLLGQAAEGYAVLGMPRHEDITRSALQEL